MRKVSFRGSTDFPAEIVFNPHLNATIRSGSSGKSALLAHVAHVVGAVYTFSQQMVASNLKGSDTGTGGRLVVEQGPFRRVDSRVGR